MIWSYLARNTDERRLLDGIGASTPIVVTDLHERIVGVNRDWVEMCKYTAQEAFGKTPRMLQGELTNREAALDFSLQLRGGKPAFAALVNYKKDGSAFVNHIHGWPLGDLLVAETYAEQNVAQGEAKAVAVP